MSRLGTSSLGHTLLTASELPSTQEFMRRHGVRLGDGVVMVADRQTSGKGEILMGACQTCSRLV